MGNQGALRKILTAILLLLVLIGVGLIIISLLNQGIKHEPEKSTQKQPQSSEPETKADINALISYELPEGWTVLNCDSGSIVLIVPAKKVSPACTALADSWPMKFVANNQNITDCSQIKVNNQQVTNHVCSSQYINGSKALVASTTYNNKSAFGKDTKVSEYADDLASAEDNYQAEFDKIANSIKVK
jgi:hypothetical protein